MTIARRTFVGYAGMLLLLLVVAGVGMSGMYWLGANFRDYSETTRLQVTTAAAIGEQSEPMMYIARAAVLTADPALRAQYLRELESAANMTRATIDYLGGLEDEGSEAEDAEALEELGQALVEYRDTLTTIVGLAATDQVQAMYDLDHTAGPLKQQFDTAVESYHSNEQADEKAAVDALTGAATMLLIVVGVIVALAFAAGALLQIFSSKAIGRQLREAVVSIGSSSAEILAIAVQVSGGAAQTAASTNEATVTVEEVKQTAVLASEKASQVADNAQNAARIAEDGRASVEETIVGIERMHDQMVSVAQTIDQLGERTQAVGEIMTTVSDLAEQSNLLAVNASIEAAKAGEYGKGFTVVAQEVKSLAEQSKQAVSQVRGILGEIQKASKMAAQAASLGREAIEAGREQSLESGEAIRTLADTVADTSQSAVQISTSSRQQLAGMEQIGQAIESINQASEHSVAGTRRVEQEVRQLQELATSLKSLVDAQPKSTELTSSY